MFKALLIALGTGLAWLLVHLAHESGEQPAETLHPAVAAEHRAPDEWLQVRRLTGSTISLATLAKANEDFRKLRLTTKDRAPAVAGASWEFLGPETIGGRVLDIAVDPLVADTLYAATASGGLWKSSDAGATFTHVWPFENAQAVGALAVTASGTLYAGVGEGAPNGTSPTLGDKGIFVSSDGAATWASLGLAESARIGRISVDPNDEMRIFVAATGPVFAPGGQRGVYRSLDGGANWTLVLEGENDTTGAADVRIDPAHPDRLYAVLWDHLRTAEFRQLGGVGSGVFRSDDGGDTWARLGGGLPPRNDDVGRIGFGMAPGNPDMIFATYIDATGFFTAFYRSADGGDTWMQTPFDGDLSGSQSSFGWWFGRTWVDPALSSRVFVAGVSLVESANTGNSWVDRFEFHADQHAMAWDAAVAGRLYLGNDGGVYRSDTNGVGASWDFGVVQPYTQFYSIDVSEQDPTRIVGGTQDNGCLRSYSLGNPDNWNVFGCGDGLETLINYENQNIIYGCSQGGSCNRSTNGGETLFSIGQTVSSRRAWQTPLVFDPNDPDVMYYAGDIVNRSTNGGVSWTAISPDLTGGDPFPGDNYTFGTVTALAPAKSDSNVIYAGTDDSRIWFTTNLGATWTRSTDADLPGRWVTRIVVHPENASVAYATYSGYREGDNTPYVFKTTNGGVDWTDITSNLPAAPVNAMALRPSGELLLGSDLSVFISHDDGASWDVLGQDLPRSPVMDLRVHEPTNTLFAATFGRGMWKVVLPAADTDGDGVADTQDNCTLAANADQTDTDDDGFGNACDPDFDQSCNVNFIDLGLLKADFFSSGDLVTDLNADGFVNFLDLAILKSLFVLPPGPSGVPNDCISTGKNASGD